MIQEQITTLTLPYPLGDKRVRVYVPAHEEGETFPVVYMTDGQNLFEDTDLRFGCWYTREAVAEERSRSGQAAIIVGIHNDESPRQRANELTPKSIGTVMLPPDMPEEERVHVNPSCEVFDDFVVNTVMPAVEEQFPVRKGRNETAFCGSSSGGLQSYFTALSHPDKFCAAGVFSPALMFYSPEDMRSWIASVMRDNMPYLYFYMGGGDELEQILAIGMDRTYDILMELYPPLPCAPRGAVTLSITPSKKAFLTEGFFLLSYRRLCLWSVLTARVPSRGAAEICPWDRRQVWYPLFRET